jgi:hypothetical protein
MSLLQNQAISDLEQKIESKTWLLGVGSDKGRTLADLLLTFLLEKTKKRPAFLARQRSAWFSCKVHSHRSSSKAA